MCIAKIARMSTPTTPAEAIEQNSLGPRSATVGGDTVTQHSIQDQIAADRYLASRRAASNGTLGFGIRTQRIKPPGGG